MTEPTALTPTKSPNTAAMLSILVPGAGHLYAGQRATGIALLVIAVGIGVSVATVRSPLTLGMMALLYLFVAISSAVDAARVASGRPSALATTSRWRIILLLFTVGPFALPLLWQTTAFSKSAKITWTVVVIAIAVGSVLLVAAIGPMLEQLMGQLPAAGL
jgi:hypothetical protein